MGLGDDRDIFDVGGYLRIARMARPIELALSRVWHIPAVKKLNIAQFGGFVLLAREALYEGFDPFSASRITLQVVSRCNPQQWTRAWGKIKPALEVGLPVLREEYERGRRTQRRKAQGAKIYFAAEYEKRRQEKLARKALESKEVRLADSLDPASVAIQPTKAPKYRPQNIDYQLRAQGVEMNKQLRPKGAVLHD